MTPSAPPAHVGVLAYQGCLGTEVFGIVDLLLFNRQRIAAASGGTREDLFRVTVAAHARIRKS
ncbi:MAG: hypothetical protein ACRDNS_16350 [Trebonia sp.]